MNFNRDWQFLMPNSDKGKITVNLPHTWNAEDGQDGGNDYFRGECRYSKRFKKSELPKGEKHYIQFDGANASARVLLNGEELGLHHGGYSTWRLNISEKLCDDNVIEVLVDNGKSDTVYPQTADFTFYGGLYRSVSIIAVSNSHFDLDYYGSPGIAVTPTVNKNSATVKIEVFTIGTADGQSLEYKILDSAGKTVMNKDVSVKNTVEVFELPDVHLWQGREDPYLYTAEVTLKQGEEKVDFVRTRFGCRSFSVDAEEGFILNGKPYPLRGVSRHQDRKGIGNALLDEHHREDAELIMEVGATAVRLAHYQHSQYFYELCDELGLVVWAEIPYISSNMPAARDNAVSQLTELIAQNYNHPSIVFWGLSNEITMGGVNDADLIETHRILNDLAHELDPTRLTVIACLTTCPTDAEYIKIPDLVAYNHYFGWYGGDTSMNGPWFDKFHTDHPETPIGVSEYGCEGLNWHSTTPVQGDYTEEYHASYLEELIKQLFSRKYLFATYVWNMFDFGADARAEGGENGQNHKGLVTFDRAYKKDAFYAYKAWLSKDPFVHICSKRYMDRVEPLVNIRVYSNMPEVELFVNGKSVGKQVREEHFFSFLVRNEGESRIFAVAGECRDETRIRRVEEPNEDYRLKEQGAVLNWFDVTAPEGRLSLNDKIDDILKSEEGRVIFSEITEKIKTEASAESGMMSDTTDMLSMLGGFTLLRFTSLVSMLNVSFTKDELLDINRRLNSISKN